MGAARLGKILVGKAVRVGAVAGLALVGFVQPLGAPVAKACSFDYIDSSVVLSKTYLGREKTYVTGTYKGPITINVQYEKSWTNSVSASIELSKIAASIGVSAEVSVSVSKSEGGSYTVPSGRYGRMYVSMPKWSVRTRETWNVCGSPRQAPFEATRTYRSSRGNATYPGKYIAGENRTTYF